MKGFFTRQDTPERAAANWLARRDLGLSAEEEQEFQQWLRRSPAHSAAWQATESAWTAFAPARDPKVAAVMLQELAEWRRRRRTQFSIAGAACAAAIAVLAVWFVRPRLAFREPDRTVPAQNATPLADSDPLIYRPERRVLPDQSVVELNKGAAIAVNYTPAQRGVRLLRGEAHFAVAKNPARPFVVTVGSVTVRDVGTQFCVRVDGDATDVLVTEGQVAVERAESGRPAGSPSGEVFVSAGNSLSIPASASGAAPLYPKPVTAEEAEMRLAWRGPRLILAETPLARAVEELNRENRTQITVADPSLASLRMSGSFRADNANGFVRLVETTYGIKVERHGDRVVLKGGPGN